MTQKDKERVIAALEEYKGDSTGLIAMTVEDCQRVVREMAAEDGRHAEIHLTRGNISVDANAARFIGGEVKIQNLGDKTLDLILNGPTLNSVNKDVLRHMIRQLYDALWDYENASGWIPVTERLPQEDLPVDAICEVVQVLSKDGEVSVGWCNRGLKCWYYLPINDTRFVGHGYELTPVVAWKPLSEPPREDSE